MGKINKLYVNIRHMNMIRISQIMKVFLFFTTLLIIPLLISSEGLAVEVENLYQAQVPVSNQAVDERKRAIKRAMANVIIKVGGQSHQDNKILKQATRNPNNYLLQYLYQTIDEQLYLTVDFDQEKINVLFKHSQAPMWGSLRPQILLWLVEENKFERNIISSSSELDFNQIIKSFADQRGLPIILPLMDLDDINTVQLSEVWGRFSEPVLAASVRYSAQKVVIFRISNHSFVDQINSSEECLLCQKIQYSVDWTVIDERQTFSDSYQGTDANKLLLDALNDMAQHFYEQYAFTTSTNNNVVIDIANVNNLKHYAQILDFFDNHSSIESVQLIEAIGSHRRFKLKITGSSFALFSSLKLTKQLQQIIDPLADTGADHVPVFHWR
jgi:hypothetical protein